LPHERYLKNKCAKLLTYYVHTLCEVQISKLYYISIDLSFDQNLITAVSYMALHSVLIYRCWISYDSDYVLVLFAPLHPLVYLYLQTNNLFMYGERRYPFSIP